MPVRGFEWIENPKEWNDAAKICSIPDDSNIGYIFEVDLKYSEELHDSHNDYPFCPENMKPHIENCSYTTEKLIFSLVIRKIVCGIIEYLSYAFKTILS